MHKFTHMLDRYLVYYGIYLARGWPLCTLAHLCSNGSVSNICIDFLVKFAEVIESEVQIKRWGVFNRQELQEKPGIYSASSSFILANSVPVNMYSFLQAACSLWAGGGERLTLRQRHLCLRCFCVTSFLHVWESVGKCLTCDCNGACETSATTFKARLTLDLMLDFS